MKQRVLLMLLVLLGLGHSMEVWADRFLQDSNNFTAMVVDKNRVQFTLPTQYDGNLNEGISDGKIKLSVNGGSQQDLIKWWMTHYRDLTSDTESGTISIHGYQAGSYQLVGKVKNGYKTFNSGTTVDFTVGPNDDNSDHFTTTVIWTVPYELRGKSLKFEVWARSDDRDYHWFMPSENEYKTMLTWDCPAAPDVSVNLTDPMIAVQGGHANELMMPYNISARSVTSATLYYTDALTNNVHTKELSKKTVDVAYIPADRPWKDIYISAKIVDLEGNTVPGAIKSETVKSNMLHYPKNLKGRLNDRGQMVLTWQVDDANEEDLATGDNFEIQRNLTGSTVSNDPNWITIDISQNLVQGKTFYTVTDSLLVDQYKGNNVSYRIRRGYASVWRWADNSGYSQYELTTPLSLPTVVNPQVQRSSAWDDESHVAQFAIGFAPMFPEKSMYNYIVLHTPADWQAFADSVNAGKTDLTVILANDIDLSGSKVMVGTESKPFVGTFEGNGYTLTVNYSTNAEYTAPFRYVSNATIRSLRVAGKLTSSAKFVAGIVGRSLSGTTTIENCRVSATIDSSVNGDATNGGLVAVNYSGVLNIDDCRFDGQLTGEKCHSNGGFVGWNDGKVNFANCLFAPSLVNTKFDGCQNFSRSRDMNNVSLTNCYVMNSYEGSIVIDGKTYFILRSGDDWDEFRDKVVAANGNSDVNAIMAADISTTQAVGFLNSIPYRGIFDGNGHTLHVNIDGGTNPSIAPFSHVKDCTIKNLHVEGTVKGAIHSSGLIGSHPDGAYTITISNVRVSTTVNCSSTHVGGFIGHGGSATHLINNCLFDGKLTASGSNTYGGAFIGWENGGTSNRVTNCLENGSYQGVSHAGMNYALGNAYGNVGENQNNYSSHSWGEAKYWDLSDAWYSVRFLGEDNWHYVGGQAVPKMVSTEVSTHEQGTNAKGLSASELKTALGDEWRVEGSDVVPVFTSITCAVWDRRAQLQLRINMHGENGVESKIVDLSDNNDALVVHQFTQELTRKCVEYSFDMILRRGNSPMKFFGTDADSVVVPVTKADATDKQSYRFQNSKLITEFVVNKKQSSVQLVWQTSDGDNDFFRVLRRKHGTEAWTDTLATNLNQLFFEDKTVLVQQVYDYRVESVWQCEGVNVDAVVRENCQCESTGMIEGYIRMADGTAMGGVQVECRPDTTVVGADALYTTTTDAAGYFVFKGLPYQTNGKYYVTVPVSGDMGSYTAPNAKGEVSFTPSTNWTQDFNFYLDTYYIYSGNVYYRDTSIPVPGVSFKLDGKVMHDASHNVITTDTQGAFELSIPRGGHKVQAVKTGHYFANDGYLINRDAPEDTTTYNFVKNVANVVLWDSTTVVLRGRVVGGDIQGSKPLGQSLSVNNLGDSLKIVMQLEGDNTSWLIRKQDDESVKSADYKLAFGHNDKDTTEVNVTRHTLTILPDKNTGEYELHLHPAKYKVIEVSAQGYATLFQKGKVGETVDLTFNVRGDTCEYSRIYHAVPDMEVTQFNPSSEPYFGVKEMNASDNLGNSVGVKLWYYRHLENGDSVAVYSFEHPVFMAGSPYGWMLQACEKYYKNNNYNAEPDIVRLSGGKVKIQNALTTDSKTAQWETELDEQGGASYIFTPDNTTFTLEGDKALKTVSITLEYDDSFYDIKPFNGKLLQGYVMASKPKPEGRKTIVTGTPKLFDILRDPPGGSSSAYIEEGSKMSYGYTWDFAATLGLGIQTSLGKGASTYHGTVAAPNGAGHTAGTLSDYEEKKVMEMSVETNYGMSWTYNYNIDITERIQTNSGKKWVGPKADLFIGMTDNVVVEDAIAVRVIPESMYKLVKDHEGGSFVVTDTLGVDHTIKVPAGTTKVLAQGTDEKGKPVYLVRDEVMRAYPQVKSTFVHSQHYIEKELLPDLIKTRNSLLLGKETSEAAAKKLANANGAATYISKVDADHENYGVEGYYTPIYPDGKQTSDRIQELNNEVLAWIMFLARNEEEKIGVMESNLVKRYDFDGGASSIQYSENFSTVTNGSRYLRYPMLSGFGNILSSAGPLMAVLKTLGATLEKTSGKIKTGNPVYSDRDDDDNATEVTIRVTGEQLKIKFNPIVSVNFNDKFSTSETYSKKMGFTLAASSKSSMMVDVYRTASAFTMDTTATVFNRLTYKQLDLVREGKVSPSTLSFADYNTTVYSNFVYRTRGGVTSQPYEDERVTKWIQPGTVIDVATIQGDKPRIWIDQPVVSNVPYDQPARFKLHFANESDYPERASLVFNYFLLGTSNPNGAKVYVDGTAINSQGVNITLYPCRDAQNQVNVFTKEIEVYPGTEFDYNDLTLCLYDPEDANRVFDCKFSAHFVPTAGMVSINSPGSNWVMNTESPYDGKRKSWYMPVRIDGFDTNYRGFDHIELQYKLSTQGEKDWVNVCSYYANDSLRTRASGVTDTIPANNVIIARFYGENDPVEQHYDLRAVNYCRHGGGYLTGMSPVLSGIKDTRLPELFGVPEPVNGILGIGDNLMLTFSEPIAGNYLSKINNFELLGTPTNNDISTSTSLSFDGENSWATSQGNRNLAGKSFTVDVMLNPASDKGDMTVFSHGGEVNGVKFGLSADRRLTAKVNGQLAQSDSIVPFDNMLREVAYVLDQSGDSMQVIFFDGSKQIGSQPLSGKYENTAELNLGYDLWESDKHYKGDMLEFRLWNGVMTSSDLNEFGKKRLSGYESGLMDNYRLNEGTGDISYDRAAGSSDLTLMSTMWKRPSGISVKFDGSRGLRLKPEKFTRSDRHDYTLMFWFRTTDTLATFFSNGPARVPVDSVADSPNNQINIGVEKSKLYLRSDGWQRNVKSYIDDGQWHHFILTVSRSRNLANVYVDQQLVDAFAADNLAGISGDHIALGATYEDKNTPTQLLKGNIDEVGMFESVLPMKLLNEYSTHTPLGTETSLMAYLDFGRSRRQDDNTMRLEPTGISLKRYRDNQGNIVARRDTLVTLDPGFVDRDAHAPMVSNSALENLNFSFVARDNQLLVNIKEPDYTIEKTNVYLTVKEIPDLQGNLMASPVTMNVYVYRNPLRWNIKNQTRDIRYGEGMTFEATVTNLTGERQTYELNDLPVWITASQTSGIIQALEEQTITFTVSPYINIGMYNEQIELISDNGMPEIFTLTLNVRGDEPAWVVRDALKQANRTMMMVARVKVDGVVASSTEDILGAFDENLQPLGVAHIEVDNTANANEALAYLTIYGYTNVDGSSPQLSFKFFDASTGRIHSLRDMDGKNYVFQKDTVVGSASQPVILVNEFYDMQTLHLKKGWNWASFNVRPRFGESLGHFLDNSTIWEAGDVIMAVNGNTTVKYTCRQDKTARRGYKWDSSDELVGIDPAQMYSIYSMSDKTVYLEGYQTYIPVEVHKDWNRLGYTSPINLPLAQALNGYSDYASEGDVIKSQDGFAVATRIPSGIVWKGSLQYMETGKGYMLKRQDDSNVKFYYPLYFSVNRYSGTARRQQRHVRTATTMNIVARTADVDLEEGDRLIVFADGERAADALPVVEETEGTLFYLNIGCDRKAELSFALERNGEIVATASDKLCYEAHKVLGTPSQPTDIRFIALDTMPQDGKWYTTSGMQLPKRPTKKGLYIHNGKVQVVK